MKRPPRLSISTPSLDHNIAYLQGPELHHMRVMRLRRGSEVTLLDEAGNEYHGRIVAMDAREARVQVDSFRRQPSGPTLILAAAIIKGPRMDFLVEKAAELGARELWPLRTQRSVIRQPGEERLKRWQRLATAAAQQSLAAAPMHVRPPCEIRHLIGSLPRDMLGVICQEDALPLGAVIRETRPDGLVVACGPEGDFDPAEIAMAERAGFRRASVAGNRLRSETAALAALSIGGAVLREIYQRG